MIPMGKETKGTNKKSEYTNFTILKRGKKNRAKSRSYLLLLLIGWESGRRFLDQSQGWAKQTDATSGYFRHSIEN